MSEPRHTSQPSEAVDDSGAGLAMFVIFTTGVLIVTGAVAIVAIVNTWWVLGVAFAIHVIMTTVVVATIVFVMNGRAGTDGAPVESRRREARPPTPRKAVTAV